MNILICKFRLWILRKRFSLEVKRAWRSKHFAEHLLRAAALLQQRQQLTDQQAGQV